MRYGTSTTVRRVTSMLKLGKVADMDYKSLQRRSDPPPSDIVEGVSGKESPSHLV